MNKVAFVTQNTEKIKTAEAALKKHAISFITKDVSKLGEEKSSLNSLTVIQYAIETPEIQSQSTQEVARFSAEYAYRKINLPVITMDVGFYITAFNGFPGTYVKSFNDSFSPERILNMFIDSDSREAYFEDTVVVMINEKDTEVFTKKIYGEIALEAYGKDCWSIDSIFVPQGCGKVIGLMSDAEKLSVWKEGNWDKVADYLKRKIS